MLYLPNPGSKLSPGIGFIIISRKVRILAAMLTPCGPEKDHPGYSHEEWNN
jgi:hypothetical protein